MQDQAEEATASGREIPDRAREIAYQAVDSGRVSTAAILESAATRLGQRMRDRGMDGARGRMQGIATEKAAHGMQEAAGYLREHEAAEIRGDVEAYVRRHPVRSVLIAVAAGIVFGRILR